MTRFPLQLLSAFAVLCLLSASGARAASVFEVGFFNDVSAFDFRSSFDPPPSGGFFFVSEPVTGIDRFDPSLGTLTDVIVTAEFDFDSRANALAASRRAASTSRTRSVSFSMTRMPRPPPPQLALSING